MKLILFQDILEIKFVIHDVNAFSLILKKQYHYVCVQEFLDKNINIKTCIHYIHTPQGGYPSEEEDPLRGLCRELLPGGGGIHTLTSLAQPRVGT